jgi:3-deoxy-7-phosphoheptulonate synthase
MLDSVITQMRKVFRKIALSHGKILAALGGRRKVVQSNERPYNLQIWITGHPASLILLKISEIGFPAATEFLETITPQYVADLFSWACIGARTTESQTHRELASGLSMAVGFKNETDGNMSSAIHAIVAAKTGQNFLGIDQNGHTCVVQTNGNPVLRGGQKPIYDPISIEQARLNLIQKGLPETIMVDCSHGNSTKKYQGQGIVMRNVIDQLKSMKKAYVGKWRIQEMDEWDRDFIDLGDESRFKATKE